MFSGIVAAIAFVAALIILPRFVFGGRRGRIKVRFGPTIRGQAFLGLARLFLRYWMYTVPVTLACIILTIGYTLTS